MRDDAVLLGEVVGVFGIRGELRVMLHNREDSALRVERPVWLVAPDGVETATRMKVRPGAGKRILATVPGVTTPEAAAALQGARIWIDRAMLPAPAEGEFYVADLVGCRVLGATGAELGTLADVVPGERDVWVVETPEGEAWLVATPENVLGVDVVARVVRVADDALSPG